jgi:HEAT repeat protein
MKIFRISVLLSLLLIISLFAGCTGESSGDFEISGYIDSLKSGTQEEKKKAAEALAEKGEAAIPQLSAVLTSEDKQSATWAAVALIRMGETSVEPMIGLLSSGDENQREWAANILACIGEPAYQPLIAVINTGNQEEIEGASLALIKIGGPVLPLLSLELNTNPDANLAEIDSVIRSIYATAGLQERLSNTTAPDSPSGDETE